MGRLLFLFLLVVGIVWLLKRAVGAGDSQPERKPPVHGDLVACARCGVNVPREEAAESAGALFCSEEHARLGRG